MTAVAEEEPIAPPQYARLRLEAHPSTLAMLQAALSHLPLPGLVGREQARMWLHMVMPSLVGLTGGVAVTEAAEMPPGLWRLQADGRPLLSGTVIFP